MVDLKYDFNRLKDEKLRFAVAADTGITRSSLVNLQTSLKRI